MSRAEAESVGPEALRLREGQVCLSCQQDLRGLPEGAFCPECGEHFYPVGARRADLTFLVAASLILAVPSWFFAVAILFLADFSSSKWGSHSVSLTLVVGIPSLIAATYVACFFAGRRLLRASAVARVALCFTILLWPLLSAGLHWLFRELVP